MAALDGQLGKIKFIFYPNSKAPGVGVPYVPMYNPTSFSINHSTKYDKSQKMSVGDMVKKFVRLQPRVLNLELFFDGTGASPSTLGGTGGKIGVNTGIKSVYGQIQTFLKACISCIV